VLDSRVRRPVRDDPEVAGELGIEERKFEGVGGLK
jgi:hypothetical protein